MSLTVKYSSTVHTSVHIHMVFRKFKLSSTKEQIVFPLGLFKILYLIKKVVSTIL